MGGCVSKDEERVSLPQPPPQQQQALPRGCLKKEKKQKQNKKTSEEEFQQLVAEGFIPTDTPMPGCKEELKKLIKQGETKKKFEQWKEKHNMVVVDGRLVSAPSAMQDDADPTSSFSSTSLASSRPNAQIPSLLSSSSLHSNSNDTGKPSHQSLHYATLSKVDELCDDAESLQGSESTTPQQQHMSRNPLVVGRGSNIVNDDSFVGVRDVLTESFGDDTGVSSSPLASLLKHGTASSRHKSGGGSMSSVHLPSSGFRSASQSEVRRVSFTLPTNEIGDALLNSSSDGQLAELL